MNKYQYKVQGVDYDVEIEEVEGNVAKVNVNGIRFDVELKQPINPTSTLKKVRIEAPKPVARPAVRSCSSRLQPTNLGSRYRLSCQGPAAWHSHRTQGQRGRHRQGRRYRHGTRGHEDAEQHRVGIRGHRHLHHRQAGRNRHGEATP